VLLVVGVIAVHTAIVYGVTGSFYLEDYDSIAETTAAVLTTFVAVGFLFGLGAFFPTRESQQQASNEQPPRVLESVEHP
jgi:hypothetical protein